MGTVGASSLAVSGRQRDPDPQWPRTVLPGSMDGPVGDMALPGRVVTHTRKISHVRQRHEWDCGLACAEMALLALGRDPHQCAFEQLSASCRTRSVWSVDLAMLLAENYAVSLTFATETLGVNPGYATSPFYARGLGADRARVAVLFARALTSPAVVVQHRRVQLSEIRDAIADRGDLVIVLVDKRRISCQFCEGPASKGLGPLAIASNMVTKAALNVAGFLGHYILIHTHDPQTDAFYYMDPASRFRDSCIVAGSTLEDARTAFGTDYDTLFLHTSSAIAATFGT